MSWFSDLVKRNKGVIRPFGKLLDAAGDYVPVPGVRDALNFSGKIIQGQNLKKAALGTALDYAGGKLGGAIARKIPLARGGNALANKYGAEALANLPVGVTGATAVQKGIAGYAPNVISTVANPVAAAVSRGNLGSQIAGGVKRALGGLSAGDVIKGAATGYDIYQNESDRRYNRKRTERADKMYEEDRARQHKIEDEDRAADAAWFNSLAPFRAAAQTTLLKPWTPIDYGAVFNAPAPVIRPITTPAYSTLNPANRPRR